MSAAAASTRTILFLGCGSTFSDFTSASKKHPNWEGKVTASELRSFNRSSDSCPDCTKRWQAPTPWMQEPSGTLSMALEDAFVDMTLDDDGKPQLLLKLDGDKARFIPEGAIYNFTLQANPPTKENSFFSVSKIEILGVPEGAGQAVRSDLELKSTCNATCRRIKELQQKGVEIILGLDGTKLHECPHPSLQNKAFRHIYWNCPHDGSSFKKQSLPPLLAQVVASAARVQTPGSKLHISIPQPKEPWDQCSFFQGYVYDLVRATKDFYTLYKKRKAGTERYPDYVHETTKEGRVAESAKRLREFVFIRKGPSVDKSKATIGKKPFYGSQREFYILNTDDEYSSEGE